MKSSDHEPLAKSSPRRVFLVDDHPITRQGVASLINQRQTLSVCGEASNAASAMDEISKLLPDVVIADVSLPGTSGIELVKLLKVHHPELPVLVMSMHDESMYAERAIRAGARGYIMKLEANDNILVAVEKVLRGEIYLSERIKEKILYAMSDRWSAKKSGSVEDLSDREVQVLHLIGEGFATRDIATKLSLSVKTVESYRQHLKEKLDLPDGAALVRYAIQWINGL